MRKFPFAKKYNLKYNGLGLNQYVSNKLDVALRHLIISDSEDFDDINQHYEFVCYFDSDNLYQLFKDNNASSDIFFECLDSEVIIFFANYNFKEFYFINDSPTNGNRYSLHYVYDDKSFLKFIKQHIIGFDIADIEAHFSEDYDIEDGFDFLNNG